MAANAGRQQQFADTMAQVRVHVQVTPASCQRTPPFSLHKSTPLHCPFPRPQPTRMRGSQELEAQNRAMAGRQHPAHLNNNSTIDNQRLRAENALLQVGRRHGKGLEL